MKTPTNHSRSGEPAGFTLLEVMIASGILFMCLFAILQLLAGSLRNARVLQRTGVDPGMLAATLSLTNKLDEGPVPKAFLEDFEKTYPDYRPDGLITLVGTNGLYQVDFVIYRRGGDRGVESKLSILKYTGQVSQLGRITP